MTIYDHIYLHIYIYIYTHYLYTHIIYIYMYVTIYTYIYRFGYKPEVYRCVFVLYDMGCRVYYRVVMYSRTCLKTVAL